MGELPLTVPVASVAATRERRQDVHHRARDQRLIVTTGPEFIDQYRTCRNDLSQPRAGPELAEKVSEGVGSQHL
jgi:hypothetical protein